MSRTTSDVGHEQVLGVGTDGNAVVSSHKETPGDGHSCRSLDVDSVCVRALIWSVQLYVPHDSVVAAVYRQVSHLAVYRCHTAYHDIVRPVEGERLHAFILYQIFMTERVILKTYKTQLPNTTNIYDV